MNEASILNIINHNSVDDEFFNSLNCFIELLDSLNIQYCIVGSLAMQSYLNHLQRLPNDIDVCLSDSDINILINHCIESNKFKVEENYLANKIFINQKNNKFYLHLIPNNMKILDKISNTVYDRVNIFYEDIVNSKKILFLGNEKTIEIKVPTLEFIFCLNLFGQLNTNTINDSIFALIQNEFNCVYLMKCIDRLPKMRIILLSRLDKLKKKILKYYPELNEKLW